jgi:hypothetical protein
MENKERFQLLANAASVVQVRNSTKSSFRWFFALAGLAVVLALFRSGFAQFAWLASAILFIAVGLYSLNAVNPLRALLSQIATCLVITGYCAYSVVNGDGAGILLGIALLKPLFFAIGRYRTLRSIESVPDDYVELIASLFRRAFADNPITSAQIIELRRNRNFWSVIANEEEDHEYRLIYEQELVFLIGRKSLLGIPYSPHIRLIAPTRSFHVDVVGESWAARRKKVNLMLDADVVSPTLEMTPEMLDKALRQVVSA